MGLREKKMSERLPILRIDERCLALPGGHITDCKCVKTIQDSRIENGFSVWVILVKNREGHTVIADGLHFYTRNSALDHLDSLPYRTAKTMSLVELIPKEKVK
jgi:hypothetical protein